MPSQFDVVKLDDWFSFLKISVTVRFSRRVSSAAEYDTILRTISRLNNIKKKPSICFLFEIGKPSSNFLPVVFFDESPEDSLLLFLGLMLLMFVVFSSY